MAGNNESNSLVSSVTLTSHRERGCWGEDGFGCRDTVSLTIVEWPLPGDHFVQPDPWILPGDGRTGTNPLCP